MSFIVGAENDSGRETEEAKRESIQSADPGSSRNAGPAGLR